MFDRMKLVAAVALAAALVGGGAVTPVQAAGGSVPAGSSADLVGVSRDLRSGTTRRQEAPSGRRSSGRVARTPDGVDVAPEHRLRVGKVFGFDDREPVYDTDAYPWSTVSKVFARFPDGLWVEGSAVMVGPYQALTAAHLVFDDQHGGWADRVDVAPGYDLGTSPFGTYEAVEIRGFAGWTDSRDFDYDVALLELDADAGDLTGWMGLAARSTSDLGSRFMNTAGYPSDLDDGDGMWYAGDYAFDVDVGRIYLDGALDAAGGQSGSGVWVIDDEQRGVVGVLSHETSRYNAAARITDEIFDSLDAWLDGVVATTDLAVSNVTTDLPLEVSTGTRGRVSFEVDNFGGLDVTTLVEVIAQRVTGERILLASSLVDVFAGEFVAVDLAVTVPASLAAGRYDLVVRVNGDRVVSDTDVTNDEAIGPRITLPAEYSDIALGVNVRGRLLAGDRAYHAFRVRTGEPVLKLKLTGLRGGFALVIRPDGSTFQLSPGSRNRARIVRPQAGEWRIAIVNGPTSVRSRSYRFKASLRRR